MNMFSGRRVTINVLTTPQLNGIVGRRFNMRVPRAFWCLMAHLIAVEANYSGALRNMVAKFPTTEAWLLSKISLLTLTVSVGPERLFFCWPYSFNYPILILTFHNFSQQLFFREVFMIGGWWGFIHRGSSMTAVINWYDPTHLFKFSVIAIITRICGFWLLRTVGRWRLLCYLSVWSHPCCPPRVPIAFVIFSGRPEHP